MSFEAARVRLYRAAQQVKANPLPGDKRRAAMQEYLDAAVNNTIETFEAFYNPDGTNKGGE